MCGIETTAERNANRADEWLTPGRFSAFLALLVVATFPRVLLLGQTFVARDFGLFTCPLAHFHRESFWRGELPLWNPYSSCGIPFLAQWNTLTLYPPALIYLLLPFPWSVSFFSLAHLFWGGLGMYLLAHQWTTHRWGAALAGVIFAFNGLTLNSVVWTSQMATWSWVPWVIWLTEQAWQNRDKRVIWAVIAGSLQMLAGGPETILVTWFILFVLACREWLMRLRIKGNTSDAVADRALNHGGTTFVRPLWEANKLWFCFFSVAVLVALICAVQLLPFLQLVAFSNRDSGYSSSNWSMPPWGFANFLVPLFRTILTPQGVFFQEGQGWTCSYYAGLGTIWLVAVAVRHTRDWRVRLGLGLIALGLVLSLGDKGILYPFLRSVFPLIKLARFPVKFLLLSLIMLPLLAAYGWKAFADQQRKEHRYERITALVLVLLVGIVVICDRGTPRSEWYTPWRDTCQNGLLGAGLLVLLLFLNSQFQRSEESRRVLWGCTLLVAFWFDLTAHFPNQNPTVSTAALNSGLARQLLHWEKGPKLGRSRAMMAPAVNNMILHYMHPNPSAEEEYLVRRLAMEPNCNLLDRVPMTHSFFPLVPREINTASELPFVKTNLDFSALLDFMGVSQITAPQRIFEWSERGTAMPLVTSGQRPMFLDDNTAVRILCATDLDLRQAVLLPVEARSDFPSNDCATACISSAEFGNNSVSIAAQAPASSLIVISQTYYPAWKAYLDGKPTRLCRANYAFQAVQVPAGQHRIELRYQDRALRLGAGLSALGLAASVAILFKSRKREQCGASVIGGAASPRRPGHGGFGETALPD